MRRRLVTELQHWVYFSDRRYLRVNPAFQIAATVNVQLHSSEGLTSNTLICEMFQAESVRDAAFGCDWVGAPIPFQRCLMFIIAAANKEFQLTAGKIVLGSNVTTLIVCN